MAYDNLNKFMEKKKLKSCVVDVEKELKLKEFKERDKTKEKMTVALLTDRIDKLEEIIKILLENK